jgi:hypothetical protein
MAIGGDSTSKLIAPWALCVANLDYTCSWLGNLNGRNFDHGLGLSTGFVLRSGTW